MRAEERGKLFHYPTCTATCLCGIFQNTKERKFETHFRHLMQRTTALKPLCKQFSTGTKMLCSNMKSVHFYANVVKEQTRERMQTQNQIYTVVGQQMQMCSTGCPVWKNWAEVKQLQTCCGECGEIKCHAIPDKFWWMFLVDDLFFSCEQNYLIRL